MYQSYINLLAQKGATQRSRQLDLHIRNHVHKRKDPANFCWSGPRRTAATYSPTWWGSTIGASELNFSVRNGKRWILTAITTAIFYLRENNFNNSTQSISFRRQPSVTALHILCPRERFRAISTGQLNTLLCVHFLPINVVVSHDPLWKPHLGDGFALRCFQRLS